MTIAYALNKALAVLSLQQIVAERFQDMIARLLAITIIKTGNANRTGMAKDVKTDLTEVVVGAL